MIRAPALNVPDRMLGVGFLLFRTENGMDVTETLDRKLAGRFFALVCT